MKDLELRPQRLHVRAPCSVQVGDRAVRCLSNNISVNGMHVFFPRPEPSLDALQPARQQEIRVALPGQRHEVRMHTEVVWVDPNEVDPVGKAGWGVGLRILNTSPEDRDRLLSFIRDFRYTVLILHPNHDTLANLAVMLQSDYEVVLRHDVAGAVRQLEERSISAVLSGVSLEDLHHEGLMDVVRRSRPEPQVLVLNDESDRRHVQSFIRAGGLVHTLREDTSPFELRQAVQRAIEMYALSAEREQLKAALERANARLKRENQLLERHLPESFGGIIGVSDSLRNALGQLDQVSYADVPVHIHGETGTGKELAARALHERGPRADKAFVAQNCAGFTESILQSTLFGYRKGAFTGADSDRPGVFQSAHGGTLFLDEVAELSQSTQAMLLRVLQDGSVTPVGATTPVHVDVRVVSATHKDLREEVRAGRFREDLYFRLVVVVVTLPPLRERAHDIPLLAQHFLELYRERYVKDISGLDESAARVLAAYPWPGNVRELENEVERAVILSPGGAPLGAACFSPHVQQAVAAISGELRLAPAVQLLEQAIVSGRSLDDCLDTVERDVVRGLVTRCGGNRSRAAKLMGMPRQTLVSRLKKHGLA